MTLTFNDLMLALLAIAVWCIFLFGINVVG